MMLWKSLLAIRMSFENLIAVSLTSDDGRRELVFC